ncbi:MAG: hypothetical protein EOO92_20155 [Pedobacter sp.]|nr:MAG: hypothetical protein EOO92_20155 [Pedobacter sp.]
MSKWLILLAILMSFFANTNAQVKHKAGFTIRLADQSANEFFDKNPEFGYLYITYTNQQVATISFNKPDTPLFSSLLVKLFLSFEGDRYLLKKKYNTLELPKHPDLKLVSSYGIHNFNDSNGFYKVTSTILRDSVMHHFSYQSGASVHQHISGSEKNWMITSATYDPKIQQPAKDTTFTLHPQLKSKISHYQKKLEQNYRLWKPLVVRDSTLLISGVVEKDGSLTQVKLLLGGPSLFSEKVLGFIKQEAKSWWPRMLSQTIRDGTRIFIRLNKDDSITFSTL